MAVGGGGGGGGGGGLEVLHYWQTVKWYYNLGGGGAGGVSLLADSEVVSWLYGGLGVSHYWQRGKWDHGCMWGWGYLTVGRVKWYHGCVWGWKCLTAGRVKWYHGCVWGWSIIGGSYHKYQFCHDKSFVAKAYFCHYKRHVLSPQTPVCHHKTFVTTKMILVAAPASDTGGVSLLAEREVVSWLRVGLGVSHYWQRGK